MSANLFTASEAPSLADVLAAVEADWTLPPRWRADYRSALRTVGRILGRPLAELPAQPTFLQTRLERVGPAAAGLSKGSWANLRSRLRAVLRLAGVPVMPGRHLAPLTPAWRLLDGRLPGRKLRVGLSRLMHYGSARGLVPGDVDAGVMAAFRTALEQEALLKEPGKVHRTTLVAWNMAAATVAGWPAVTFDVPCNRKTYALPWSAFPPSLQADVQAMVRAVTELDLLAEVPHRPIKAKSAEHRVKLLRELASAAVHNGIEAQRLKTLADVVAIDVVRAGLRFILKRTGPKPSDHAHSLAITALTIARHWVRLPAEQLEPLLAAKRQLRPEQDGMTTKNRETLRAFEEPQRVDALLALPEQVMAELGRKRELRAVDCVRAQVALAVQLLTEAPLRIGNLAGLDLDRHLIRIGSGDAARWHLHVPADEVKNGVDLEFPLSAATRAMLQAYLERYRPRLLRRPSRWLFPGRTTGAKGTGLLSSQIAGLVRDRVGVRVTAHQFRHLAGFLYLSAHPNGHEVVRRLLGHKKIETTLRFYAGMEKALALRQYDRMLQELRDRQPPSPPSPRRRRAA